MPETAVARRTGLCTKEGSPIPLTGVSVDAEITALCARVMVTQRYVNRETSPIEAVYVFPLDEGAAVHGFEAIVDGTLVVGEVREREEAFERYDDALQQGHGAFLLDEERPDIFQASVGNVLPGKEVLLRIVYVTELVIEGSGVRFTVPTTVSPRYAPAQDRAGVGRPDAEALNPELAWRVPYGLDLSVRLAMPAPIARLESPSHPVSVTVNGTTATVALSQQHAALDRDFVLTAEAAGLDRPHAWVERSADGTESLAVAFVPVFDSRPTPAEIVFLVDRSGSMEGTSIHEVRNALQLCLRSLVPGCAFNILGFGSNYSYLFPGSLPYDENSLKSASEHVDGLRANLGGTEILPALKAALEQPRHGELPRQVVVLTDGQVTNTDAVLALASAHAGNARIFTFGIGASASAHLVRGLARGGGGVAEFIHPGERIESKVVRQVGRLLSPALTDVRVDWDGLDVKQAPTAIPPVYAGGRLLVYALPTRATGSLKHVARLSAKGPSGPVAFPVTIDPDTATTGTTIGALAARARIRELEESPDWTTSRGSRQTSRKATAVSREIVALSIRHSVISRETSFIAIERRDTPAQAEMQLRRIPIALAAGWGGADAQPGSDLLSASPRVTLSPPDLADMPFAAPGAALPRRRQPSSGDTGVFADASIFPALRRAAGSARVPDGVSRRAMLDLVRLQHADGSWDLSRELARAIGRDYGELAHAIAGLDHMATDTEKAWGTALACAWLVLNAADLRQEWDALTLKARRWLDGVARPPHGTSWIDAALEFLRH